AQDLERDGVDRRRAAQHARERLGPVEARQPELVERRRLRVELLLERGEERQAAGGGERAHELQLDRREPVRVVDDDVVVGVVADRRHARERARDQGVRRLAAERARESSERLEDAPDRAARLLVERAAAPLALDRAVLLEALDA